MEDIYQKLRKKLDTNPIGLSESSEQKKILRIMFTPEEAEFALKLPTRDETLEEIAVSLNEDPQVLKDKLEKMARKGTVFRIEKEGKIMYRLLPSVIGFWETPFWPGKHDQRAKTLGPIWSKYFNNGFLDEVCDRETKVVRVIPLDIAIAPTTQIIPLEDLMELVKQTSYRVVAHCPCRLMRIYEGKGCGHTTENCLHFEDMGHYMVEHGLGREISLEETINILRKANEEGLVHVTENRKGIISVICNCCRECCIWFRGLYEAKYPRAFAPSNYIRKVDKESCIGCGICIDRCPMDAIHLENEIAVTDENRCIGCGVCYPTCSGGAVSLVRKPENKVATIPDGRTYVINLLKDKGRI